MPQFFRGNNRGGRPGGGRPGGARRGSGPPRGGGAAVATRQPERPPERPTGPVEIPHALSVKELADLLGISAIDVIKELIKNGTMASMNHVLDYDTAALIAIDMGYEVSEAAAVHEETAVEAPVRRVVEDDPASLRSRPPVVTVMGHVDHGKTSLLDAIRKANVATGEAGGITQHLGAYQVDVMDRKVTFIDTPGHEAFTAMRARGAQTTDIAVIVVAADDGVMPQTREAIDHAKAANVSLVIAINKIDKEGANADKVKQQLTDAGVVIEEYGGDVPAVAVSARTRQGIDELLDTILLVADVLELKANPDRAAEGTVLESRLDKNRGPVATLLVQRGSLRPGDIIVVGEFWGHVRAMFDDRNDRLSIAGPGEPAGVLGLNAPPIAGEFFEVVADDRAARVLVEGRVQERHRAQVASNRAVSLDQIFEQIQAGQIRDLNVILKTDVQGSVEPLRQSLERLEGENVRVRVIHAATGAVTESDVNLAVASKGMIIGFNVRPEIGARNLAELNHVDIRYYRVIYEVVDDIARALQGMQEERQVEVVQGHAEVLRTFRVGRRDLIAGCRVTDGLITRSSFARVTRGRETVYDGKIATLKRFQDDVREVAEGYECGITLDEFSSFQEGDVIEAFTIERQTVPVKAR